MTAKAKAKNLPDTGGRPSAFKPEYIKRAAVMCLNGAIDAELASEFGVAISTIKNWKAKYPQFQAALKVNKEIADDRVERSLYSRAVGDSFDAVKVFGPTKDRDEAVLVPYVEHALPDVTAQIFWLKNRRKELWRDRHEHTVGGTVVQKSAEELKKEFIDFIMEHGLLEEISNLLPPKLLQGVANREPGE
jgi:hypothetical protein